MNTELVQIEESLGGEPETSSNEAPVVLKVEGVSKKFCRNLRQSMWYGLKDLSRGVVGLKPKEEGLRSGEFWALQDINFELRKGEILGIIGANGSGKSTLLRVLTGIFPPDKGNVWIDGTVGGIIALGAGMHPHMTGRENVYLNGTILGMSKEEIDSKFDEIVDFSEIGDFLDAPLSTYSSGMKVRLGFAVAVHGEPDILLVDEVLAVGDLSFQNKSMRKLKKARETAKAVIFISHNLENIRQLSDRVLILNEGLCLGVHKTHKGISLYQDVMQKKEAKKLVGTVRKGQIDERKIKLIGTSYNTTSTSATPSQNYKEPLSVTLKISIIEDVEFIYINLGIANSKGEACIWSVSEDYNCYFENINRGFYELNIKIDDHKLMPGLYETSVAIRNKETNETYLRCWLPFINLTSEGQKIARAIVDCAPEFKLIPIV